ncbi:hypothetical protein [Bradyrhizobium sp. 170]|uniref:hypothetical protein n=1 Tax=Bradyrhizobium sp. 170 TaxID=2782641 RepID=UPI001FFE6705|nr:hypothetical protein [Bradyrhizobium sp. 170]UPK03083.1 hypothetical protein IVB05_36995 [Bradyrhizobium sp. 170]
MKEPLIVHAPPNKQLRIDEVYLFISVDETGEGVCAARLMGAGSLVPLIAADVTRMEQLIPIARNIAKATGKQVKLIKLSQRSELMTFQPDDGGAMQ